MLQSIVRSKSGWDDPLEAPFLQMWDLWLKQVPYLTNISIPRCIYNNTVTGTQLHYFCDASKVGYGAVCYIRNEHADGDVSCHYIFGKARLAPIKPVTIPRLELSSAVSATSLHEGVSIEHRLNPQMVFFWADCTTVLQYIRNTERRFKTFVANRLFKIHKVSTPDQWRYVDGDLNPADIASRGVNADKLYKSDWLSGPDFLLKDQSCWPNDITLPDLSEIDIEIESNNNNIICCAVTYLLPLDKINLYYSSWERLIRSICRWIRFVYYVTHKDDYREKYPSAMECMEEVQHAEKTLIRYIQNRDLGDVVSKLREGDDQSDRRGRMKKILKCNPIMRDGILRVGGRLRYAPVDYDKKHPIILPKGHFSNLVIQYYHDRNGHVGPGHTWALIRDKYWILNGGVEVRKFLNTCLYCRRRNAKCGEQLMADLPEARVTPDQPPFTTFGVDYFGPIFVKQNRSTVKRFGCLFSCLVTRAVHIEIAHSLDLNSFINAFRRFCSRRGFPKVVYSGNATNFVGAERELRESLSQWNQDDTMGFMLKNNITWNFNPPRASHMGGAWERMIRSVRRLMRTLLGDQVIDDEGLVTVLVEIEGILNSRPLTPVTYHPGDDEPLTPNHLLLFRANSNIPPGVFSPNDKYAHRRWRQMQYIVNKFWQRWKTEYLPLLLPRQKWQKTTKNLSINDVVFICGEERRRWHLGRITDVFPDKHGLVRTAEVKTANGTYVRPLSKMWLFESPSTTVQ